MTTLSRLAPLALLAAGVVLVPPAAEAAGSGTNRPCETCGGGGDPVPVPKPLPPPPPHTHSIVETSRIVRVHPSNRVYGQMTSDLMVNGVRRVRVTAYQAFSAQVLGIRIDAGPASAVCEWDGHNPSYAVVTTRAWRNNVKTYSTANWAPAYTPGSTTTHMAADCNEALEEAFRDSGTSQDDLTYYANKVASMHPLPATASVGGGTTVFHHFSVKQPGIVAGGPKDNGNGEKIGWVTGIGAGVVGGIGLAVGIGSLPVWAKGALVVGGGIVAGGTAAWVYKLTTAEPYDPSYDDGNQDEGGAPAPGVPVGGYDGEGDDAGLNGNSPSDNTTGGACYPTTPDPDPNSSQPLPPLPDPTNPTDPNTPAGPGGCAPFKKTDPRSFWCETGDWE